MSGCALFRGAESAGCTLLGTAESADDPFLWPQKSQDRGSFTVFGGVLGQRFLVLRYLRQFLYTFNGYLLTGGVE